MDTIIRGVIIYVFLLIIFRLSGKRTLNEATVFDFVLLLIIAETTQQALLGDDFSLTNGMLLIMTLVMLDIILSLLKQKFMPIEKMVDGGPLIILDNGKLLRDRMRKERVDKADILESARDLHGLQRLDQIKYAILEKNGRITIIPREDAG
ncbi:MAG TPA: YetF domain-containing protein [Pontibacter sp.]